VSVIGEIDRIAHGLAHFALSVRADEQRNITDDCFGFREYFAIEIVELTRHLTREFDVGLVVASHRDNLRAREQNIHGLEDGIAKQAKRHGIDVGIACHVFESGHAFQARHSDQHLKEQVQLIGFRESPIERRSC
jgi:hypothetical protein